MNQCPKCRSALSDGAQFCSQCGYRMGLKSGVNKLWYAAGAVLVVGAIAFGIGASGILKGRSEQPDPKLLQTRAETSSGMIQQRAEPPSGLVQQRTDPPQRVEMPADVRAWLEHLERTERRRVEVTQEQLGTLMVRMVTVKMGGALEALKDLANDDPSAPVPDAPNADFAKETAMLKESWRRLTDEFNSLQPPAECVPIRNDYDQALRETGAMMMDVLAIMDESGTDPRASVTKLMKMEGTSTTRIDAAAKSADAGVQTVCDRYETRKWFSVSGDIGGGGMLQKMGGIGL